MASQFPPPPLPGPDSKAQTQAEGWSEQQIDFMCQALMQVREQGLWQWGLPLASRPGPHHDPTTTPPRPHHDPTTTPCSCAGPEGVGM